MVNRDERDSTHFQIILVDDDPVELLLLEEILADAAVDLVAFADAELAWRWLLQQSAPPHLMLLDLHLAGLDAVTALRRIRAQPAYDDMVVVLRAGPVREEQMRTVYDAGGNAIVDKPLTLAENTAQLQAIITTYRRLEGRSPER